MYRKLDSSEIKNLELEILKDFYEFCHQNNLKFYLSGGTLLGAIRHKGFIPWDDDIDICMPRPDYKRMLQTFSSTKSYYELKSNRSGDFSAPFSKVVDIRTVLKTKYSESNINEALWIDIFPVDGLPSDIHLVEDVYKKEEFYRTILALCDARLGEGKNFFRKIAKYVLKPLARLYGRERCINKMEQIASKYDYEDSEYVGAITWGLYGVGERMLKSEYEKSIEVEFEGYKFPAFSCWDSYLKGLYGDYMQLPPIEKRQTHDMEAYMLEDEE